MHALPRGIVVVVRCSCDARPTTTASLRGS